MGEKGNLVFEYGQILAPLCSFLTFSHSNNKYSFNFDSIIRKGIENVLGIWTRGHRTVGTDETTELWQPLKVSRTMLGNCAISVNYNGLLHLCF